MGQLIALVVFAVTLSGCAQKHAFEEMADGPCTSTQSQLIEEHISGQIDALAEKDWELAYSFASKDFQASVAIDQFTFIIDSQYAMLIENQGYRFDSCAIASEVIKQEVSVTSDEQVFSLSYRLSFDGETLGVESAGLSNGDPQQNV